MHNQQKKFDSLVGFVNNYRGNAALKFIFKNISLIYGFYGFMVLFNNVLI